MMTDDRSLDEHLSAEDVAAYADQGVSARDRIRIEEHLAECGECRLELLEVTRQLRSRPHLKRWHVIAPAAAAAAAAVIFFLAALFETPARSDDVLRGSEPQAGREGNAAVVAVAPLSGSTVDPENLVFIWHSLDRAFYQLTLTDANGDVVLTLDTSDTVVALPSTTPLESERIYFWYVDALLPDGRSATTGVSQFATPP
jgi:hypothetical protein